MMAATEVRQARTHQLYRSNQVRRDLSLHLLVAHFLDCAEKPVGGVADNNVDASKPSLTDLTAFVAVSQHRSFRAAADAIGVSRSSLSHAMRGLEEQLGVRLLHRTTRSVAPTEARQLLVQRLAPMLHELDDMLATVGGDTDGPVGRLRINAAVDAPGALTLDHNGLMVEAAEAGLGIAFVPEPFARRALEEGRLVALLAEWSPAIPGLCLYYPGHRHAPPALRAFIEELRSAQRR
jgi:DNA-binding transcriptional LysR family regulator